MFNPVDLEQKFALIEGYWEPKIVGELNGQVVKIARLKGAFVWHHHDAEDELFYVFKGRLVIRLRDQDIRLAPGQFFIIPRGVEHLPVAEEEVQVMLFEPKGVVNTGNVTNERTIETLDTI